MNKFWDHQKLTPDTKTMLLEAQFDDIIEFIEDYCLMMLLDHQHNGTTLVGIRARSLLNSEEWALLIEQLKQVKLFGMPMQIIEKYNHDHDVDELHISWGYQS